MLWARALASARFGRWIARAARAPIRARGLTTRVTRAHAVLLRASCGRLRRSWLFAAGQPVVGLTTIGRKSGLERTTTVAAFSHGDALALAAMNLGSKRNPGWSHNLDATPEALITVGGCELPVTARRAHGEEAATLWSRWLELQPSASTFAQLAGRRIPIFVLEPRRAGW
jgi:deazaflavin-dependent oxidoreductase (nitroreductase family)